MSREHRTHRPDNPPDHATLPAIHATHVRDSASERPSPLAHLDAGAVSALSSKALARYEAYKEVLLAREQYQESLVSTLTLFIWDLSESR